MNKKALEWQRLLKGMAPEEVLKWATTEFSPGTIVFSSSLGAEDQVLTDMLCKNTAGIKIFTLDTGRLPIETHNALNETEKRYKIKIEVLRPDAAAVEKMEKEYGSNLFYESIEKRKLCCSVRKIEPLRKKLSSQKAWICGLRKDQAVTRAAVQIIEWDETFCLYKINPLADWTQNEVWDYIRANKVPYNKLHDKGYPSIGCEPCTKAVKPGDDARAGRWWWEKSMQKECGLHRQGSIPGDKKQEENKDV